uniref:ATP synthase complex subunit 8 n=1 Tax=Moolgarda perusii TaxID=1111165 RepID=A0A7L9R591_9TELE|nr:ATP synthase F0 subunit 8 [Moolgarda perusii]QOL10557.1 ATP synthase F0 subunit 8 [Moolgarda perusii]
MPQLDPSPWLMILVFSWFIFLAFITPKILTYVFPSEPTSQNAQDTQDSKTLDWGWHW